MQTSVSRNFELEVHHVRGLVDYHEHCQCGCRHLLLLYKRFRIIAPFAGDKGQASHVKHACIISMIIEGDKHFLLKDVIHTEVILDMVKKYDYNKLRACDLACANNLHPLNTFASSEERKWYKN